MLKHTLSLLVCLFLTLSLSAQSLGGPLAQLRVDVVYLSSDYLEGRETGLKGEQLAADYIAWRFSQLGLQPKGQNGSWFHEFDFQYNPNPHAQGGEARMGRNVVAYLDNGAPTTVVIGAHYDHLGHGEFGSLYTGEPAIHNGADDNASGIAALLYIAEKLAKEGKGKGNNYLFMGFSGEELGLVGSKKWTASPTIDLGKVNYMINMDMVGRLNEQKVLAINGVGTSPAWKSALENIRVGGIQAKMSESGVGPSDHTSFYLQKIPALHFFTGQHSEYHKPVDDASMINFEGLLAVGDYILAMIERLDTQGKLAFTATKDDSEKKAASFKVSLGVMPDYVHNGKGMRVDSVIEGRPGQKAGMAAGDIILRIGEKEVTDIYTYMEGLSQYKTGDETKVVIQRGEEEKTLKVKFE